MKPIDRLRLGPMRRVEFQADGTYKIFVKPPEMFIDNPVEKSVTLTSDQYRRYIEWMATRILIQGALPELLPSQREVLMTGL